MPGTKVKRTPSWLITLTLNLIKCENIILEQSAGSKSGVYVDLYCNFANSTKVKCIRSWLLTLTLNSCDNIILERGAGSQSGVYVEFYLSASYNYTSPCELVKHISK